MRTYRTVILSMGWRDKVTALTRAGVVSWYDEFGERCTRDIPASHAKIEMTYQQAIDYFRDKGYESHPTTHGTNWRMMRRSIGEAERCMTVST